MTGLPKALDKNDIDQNYKQIQKLIQMSEEASSSNVELNPMEFNMLASF